MANGFGQPKYGSGQSYKTYDLKGDKNGGSIVYIFRLLPPMKSLAEIGKWAVYHGIHFGYAGVDFKDPTRTRQRPFKCIEEKNFKTQLITRACPECSFVASKVDDLETQTIALKKNPEITEEQIEEQTADLKEWIYAHNTDRKWYINVMAPGGTEFGVLRIAHKTKKLLDETIKKTISEEGIDPLALDQGVWIKFTRIGKKIEIQDQIEIEYISQKDPATGKSMKTIKPAALTQAQIDQALRDCPDLNTEVVRIVSEEQIQALVNSSGDPEEVDGILSIGQKTEGSPKPASAPRPTAKPAPVAVPKPPPVKSAPVAVPKPAPAAAAAPRVAPQAPPAASVATTDPVAAFRAMGFSDAQIQGFIASLVPATPPASQVTEPEAEPEIDPVDGGSDRDGPDEPEPETMTEPTPAADPTPAAAVGLPKDRFMALFNKKAVEVVKS